MSGSQDNQIAQEMIGELARETACQTGVFDVEALPLAGLPPQEDTLYRFQVGMKETQGGTIPVVSLSTSTNGGEFRVRATGMDFSDVIDTYMAKLEHDAEASAENTTNMSL